MFIILLKSILTIILFGTVSLIGVKRLDEDSKLYSIFTISFAVCCTLLFIAIIAGIWIL